MKKYIAPVVTFLVLVIIAAGLFYVLKIYPENKNQPPVDTNQPDAVQNTTITTETKAYFEENKDENYKFDIKYPEFSSFKNAEAQTKVNADIKNKVLAERDEFKKTLNCKGTPDDDQVGNPCVFNTEFNAHVIVNNKILSVPLQNYYYTQGAHGSVLIWFANYDIETGEAVDFKNVFIGDYVKFIADYSKAELVKKIGTGTNAMSDTDWIQRGTDFAVAENYEGNIGFKSDGITVVFQQYQVAAYAAGPQTVFIPYTALTSIISPTGPLAELAK